MTYKAICFDMDGVIFSHNNFWKKLHTALGTEKEGLELTKKYLKTDYPKLVETVVGGLWKGKSAEPYFELINSCKYNEGVQETVKELRDQGLLIMVISSGPSHLMDKVRRDLNVIEAYSNEIVIKDNLVTGDFVYPVAYNNKLPILREICNRNNIKLSEVAVVGDDENDLEMFQAAGLSIAFNSTSEVLKENADITIEGTDLKQICVALQNEVAFN